MSMRRNWKTCGGHASVTRRHFLFGAASAALLGVRSDAATATSRAAKPRGSARACIFINLNGGASHLDTFDPKDGPWNAADVDLAQHPGGLVLSRKLFPKLSNLTQDVLALRSCSSWDAAHERAQFSLQ